MKKLIIFVVVLIVCSLAYKGVVYSQLSRVKPGDFSLDGVLQLKDISEPNTPSTGFGKIFVEGKVAKFKDEDGTVSSMIGAGGGISNVVEDLTPQLGGDLDLNGKNLDFPTTPNISDVLDEDNMASDSATKLATQQSIKAYADSIGSTVEGTAVLSTGEGGGSKFLREDGDNTCSWIAIPGGGDALTANPLSQFAATTSLQLLGVISNETGTGLSVFNDSPTFITPALGTPASGVATNLTLARIAGSTFSTVQHLQNIFHSAGWVSGGGITDDTDGTITVATGTGLIRATDSATAEILFTDWSAESGANVNLADNDVSWVYVEYNAGSPQVVATTTERTDFNKNILLAVIQRSGTTLHINNPQKHVVGDHANSMIRRLKETMKFGRVSGAVISATGTRNWAITTGDFWEGLGEFTLAAFNSSGADTFSYWYRQVSDSGWNEVVTQSAIHQTNYDDNSGSLATLSNNKYGIGWCYIETDDHAHVVYGQGDYTLAEAEDAAPPSGVPGPIEANGILVGKIIIKKSGAAFTQIESAFGTTFTGSVATDHANLATLAWTSAGHTGTPSTFAGFNGGGAATEFTAANYMLKSVYDIDTNNFVDKSETVVIEVNNDSGSTITDGTVVYISAFDIPSDLPEILAADADSDATMPATGIVNGDIVNGADGEVIISGIWEGDTSSFSVMDELYISGTAGALTTTKPTGTALIQKFAIAARVHATQGQLVIIPFRTNDIPNIASANFWLGNGSGVGTAVTMSGDATMANDGTVTVADDQHAHTASTISGLTEDDMADGSDIVRSGIEFIIDGGGSAITTGIKGDIEIPFNCTIIRVTMLPDTSTSTVVDIWVDTYANYPPTDADTITASAVPTITTAVKSQDSTLTDWTTALTAGSTIRWNVDSNDNATRLLMSLIVEK